MSDSEDFMVTYTEVSCLFEELLDIGSPGVDGLPMMPHDSYSYVVVALQAPPSPDYVPGPENPPTSEFVSKHVYPEFMPPEDDVLPAEEQTLPAAISPTATIVATSTTKAEYVAAASCCGQIVMENPNHPNDPNVLEGDQAPAAPDGFAPQWIDPEVNEEVMDDDDLEDDVECLMAPVTPPRATMTVLSTYEVGGPSTAAIEGPSFPLPAHGLPVPPIVIEDLGTRLGNLEYKHGVLMRKMEEVSDAEVADSISIGGIHPRVATMGEQVQVMESQAVQVVNRLKEIETRVQQVESIVDTHPSGQMAVHGSSQQVQTLQTALHETELQNQQLWSKVTEMESQVGILMSYMLWMEDRLTVLEKRLPGPPPRPQ
uniref:Uncharacterized protein n=1 Tax=Tanacetum cinerariifolium TaxID=118510 RepID=A0A6L2KEV0_TANCI|nr:hypothetical protein [Tanacetum cinerariifolium]